MFNFDPNKAYQKTTKSSSLIRFQDCDPLRHLNNAKYFDYYFNAREDQVPKLYGIKQSLIFKEFSAVWVVYNHQIAYIRPAPMGEWVKIFSRIIWHNQNSMLVEYFMTNEEDQIRVGKCKITFMDYEGYNLLPKPFIQFPFQFVL